MKHKDAIKLAQEAGAKLGFHKNMGKDAKVMIADEGEAGNATYFIDYFAFLVEQKVKNELKAQ